MTGNSQDASLPRELMDMALMQPGQCGQDEFVQNGRCVECLQGRKIKLATSPVKGIRAAPPIFWPSK